MPRGGSSSYMYTEEYRLKMAEAQRRRYGNFTGENKKYNKHRYYTPTGEGKGWAKGKTKETDARIAKYNKAGKNNPMYGKSVWLGRKHTEEAKRKNREAHKGLSAGPKNPFWKDGKGQKPYPWEWTEDLKDSIRKRDGFKCRLCKAPQEEFTQKLPVHHIDYDKENLNPTNLITLCDSCHGRTHYKREYWKDELMEVMKNGW